MAEVALCLDGVSKAFRKPLLDPVVVLDNVCLQVARGAVVAIVGASGTGKSTLLHIAAGLEPVDAGRIFLGPSPLTARNADSLRLQHIGFVYQQHHLLADFSALENVMLPMLLAGQGRAAAGARAQILLEQVGLADRAAHRPGALSGGQQQRVAIARALANRPTVILADEPTGNLDPENAARVFAYFLKLARAEQTAVVLATHNRGLAQQADRLLCLRDHGVYDA